MSIKIKVISEPTTRGTPIGQVAEIQVADATGVALLDAWQGFIALLSNGKSYILENVVITSWNNVKKFATCTYTSGVELPEPLDVDNTNFLFDVEATTEQTIIGTLGLVSVMFSLQCLSCDAFIKPSTSKLLVCSTCKKQQKTAL